MNILNSTIKATLKKYKPQIIGVTGSVGKTLVIGALKAVLGNHNLGVMPQGDIQALKSVLLGDSLIRAWLRNLFGGRYPKKIILEYPLLGHADLRARLQLARPDVLVVTGLGELPMNVDLYDSREGLVRDVEYIVESVNNKGLVVLDADDATLKAMKVNIKGRVMTYGFDNSPDVKIANFENRTDGQKPQGISFKLEHGDELCPRADCDNDVRGFCREPTELDMRFF